MNDKSLEEQIEAEEARLRGAYLQYNDARDRLSEAEFSVDQLEGRYLGYVCNLAT